MKVKVSHALEVSDEQRLQIARVIHDDPNRAKSKWADREEMKDYIWEAGALWEEKLAHQYAELTGHFDESDELDDDDLLGGGLDDQRSIDDLLGEDELVDDDEDDLL